MSTLKKFHEIQAEVDALKNHINMHRFNRIGWKIQIENYWRDRVNAISDLCQELDEMLAEVQKQDEAKQRAAKRKKTESE